MSKYLFTAREYADKCLALAKNYNTAYALGMWGFKLTREVIDVKAKQYPGFYTLSKTKQLYALADEGGYWGFDCVCMIKALLWGWGSDLNDKRGGAKYASNGVPDFGADSIGKYCDGFTSDFSQIEPGEALWMDGHVGVYVGGGLAVECTAAWESKVIVTAVGNTGKVEGFHTRTWRKHGKLKWIDYKEEDQPMTPAEREEFEALKRAVAAQGNTIDELKKRLADVEKINKVYHWYSQLPNYARPVIEALHKDGVFSGAGPADMDLPYQMMRMLVIEAHAGVYGEKYVNL